MSLPPASAYTYGPAAARQPGLEVLLTDGLGGFALSSLAGVPTRRSSGLVVSHRPPLGRWTHLISPLERLRLGGEEVTLHALEVAPGVFEGRGLDLLTGATVWDLLPEREQLWRGAWVRRRACVPAASGALTLTYEVRARQSVTLTLGGYFVDRDPGSVRASAPALGLEPAGLQAVVRGERSTRVSLHFPARAGGLHAPPVQALTPQPFAQRVYYRMDEAQGEEGHDYALGCALWEVTLPPGGGEVALVFQGVSEEREVLGIPDPWTALDAEAVRRRHLVDRAWQACGVRDELVATLAVAADAYLVRREEKPGPGRAGQGGPNTGKADSGNADSGNAASGSGAPRPGGLTILAGYPWFGDWGRDAMLSLTGLTLVTGREVEGRAVLRTFLRHRQGGLLPNAFLEDDKLYNSVDAALWMAVALERQVMTTGDQLLAGQALPALREVIGHYAAGTAHGIRAEPSGLLRAGEDGVQLTWMDAKIHDWVVTPRQGLPVEVQGLWLAALGAEVRLSQANGERPQYAELFERAHHAFKGSFWQTPPETRTGSGVPGTLPGGLQLGDPMTANSLMGALLAEEVAGGGPVTPPSLPRENPGPGAALGVGLGVGRGPAPEPALLADSLSPSGEADLSLRPNAVVALALPDTPATVSQVDAVIDQTERHLLTPLGLHTLSPRDPRYLGTSGGPQLLRDAAYHQGAVWPWPLTSYVELLLSRGEVNRARAALAGLVGHVWEAGIGHVSELFSGDTLTPGGCPFQAWSVAELLRAHVLVSMAEAERQAQRGGQEALLRG